MASPDTNALRLLIGVLESPARQPDIPGPVRGVLGRQRRGHWGTTVAGAWGVLAMEKFAALSEKAPVTGRSTASLAGVSKQVDWDAVSPKGDRLLFASPAAGCRIAYPADGTVIALDPDIPPEEQKVFFEARPASPGLRWLLNGREVGRAGRLQSWAPQRRAFRLALVDGAERTLDTITFVVRWLDRILARFGEPKRGGAP